MQKIVNYIVVLFALILLIVACKSKSVIEEFPESDKGFAYFPLEIGKFLEYKVDSIVYDITPDGSVALETTSYLREVVTDTFRDNTNRLIYTIERFKRSNPAAEWQIADVWTAYRDAERAERTEENLRFIKIVFPIIENNVWNGNLFIDETLNTPIAGESMEVYKSWNYSVLSIGEAEEIEGTNYPEVCVLQQADNENLIELRYAIEKYAKDIGLVYREMRILDSQCIPNCDDPNQPADCFCGITWDEKAEKGFILKQVMINHN